MNAHILPLPSLSHLSIYLPAIPSLHSSSLSPPSLPPSPFTLNFLSLYSKTLLSISLQAFVYMFNIFQIPNVAWQSYLQLSLNFAPWILVRTVTYVRLAAVLTLSHLSYITLLVLSNVIKIFLTSELTLFVTLDVTPTHPFITPSHPLLHLLIHSL